MHKSMLLAFIVIVLALLSQSETIKTLTFALVEGRQVTWNGLIIPTNYDYLTWDTKNELVINRINPNFMGSDIKNALIVSDNSKYWRALSQEACKTVEDLCRHERSDQYLSTTTDVNGYQIIHTSSECDMVLHYRGDPDKYIQYKQLVQLMFTINCEKNNQQ